MTKCPNCKTAGQVRNSEGREAFDGLMSLFGLHPFRCEVCRTRFFRFRRPIEAVCSPPPVKKGLTDLARWASEQGPVGSGVVSAKVCLIGRFAFSNRLCSFMPAKGVFKELELRSGWQKIDRDYVEARRDRASSRLLKTMQIDSGKLPQL